jgi:hypothetical protein
LHYHQQRLGGMIGCKHNKTKEVEGLLSSTKVYPVVLLKGSL